MFQPIHTPLVAVPEDAPRPGPAIPVPDGASRMSLNEARHHFDAFRHHARWVTEVSPYTIAWYKQSFANLARYLSEHDLTLPARPQELDLWVAWNRQRGIARDTVNSYWRAMRAFFKYLGESVAAPNPYRGASKPKLQAPEDRLRDALPPEQLRHVLDAAEHYPWTNDLQAARAVALVGIMLYAGLRKGEVLRLHFKHVNVQSGAIQVFFGKGGKSRTVYMPTTLRVILGRYIELRSSFQLPSENEAGFTCPEFFVSSRANRGLSEIQFRRIIKRVRRASGVPFFAHLLRHSYITMLVTEHVPLHDVQRLAGHSDIKTTAIYLHANDDRMRAAVEKLDVRRGRDAN